MDNNLECKKQLKEIFEKSFQEKGLNSKYDFYNINTRNNIIKRISQSDEELDWLEENYNDILSTVIKKYELNEQYKRHQQNEELKKQVEKMEPVLEKQRKDKEKEERFFNTIEILFGHPFIILFIVIICLLIWIFMGALGLSFFPALGISLIVLFVLTLGFLGKI